MTYSNRWMSIALKIAHKSPNVKHKMGAIVVKGGSIISQAYNLNRQGRHAELRALKPNDDMTGAVLYVMRSNSRCSKPCNICEQAIRDSGVKEVVYINCDSKPERMKFYEMP